jgi:hypothetical protein
MLPWRTMRRPNRLRRSGDAWSSTVCTSSQAGLAARKIEVTARLGHQRGFEDESLDRPPRRQHRGLDQPVDQRRQIGGNRVRERASRRQWLMTFNAAMMVPMRCRLSA